MLNKQQTRRKMINKWQTRRKIYKDKHELNYDQDGVMANN